MSDDRLELTPVLVWNLAYDLLVAMARSGDIHPSDSAKSIVTAEAMCRTFARRYPHAVMAPKEEGTDVPPRSH